MKSLRSALPMAMAVLLCGTCAAGAQRMPPMNRTEAAQLYAAGGFPIVNDQPSNACRAPAKPTITFLDLNGDKRPEALFIDRGPCYLLEKAWFSIAAKGADGQWRQLIGRTGSVRALATATRGWIDLEWQHGGKTWPLRYDGTAYTAPIAAPTGVVSTTAPPAAAATQRAAPSTDAAIFLAAGFKRRGNTWRSDCDDPGTATYTPGAIESRSDINGDGRPDAIVTEGGTYCYGNTGTAFWIVSQQSDGRWTLVTRQTGIAEFLKTRGLNGWPDLLVGGPGFCFPVLRWNGSAYMPNRKEYQGKPCK